MRKFSVLLSVLMFSALPAAAQTGPFRVLIYSRTAPASDEKALAGYADYFEHRVQQMMMDKYPCADPMTRGDISALIDWDRQRTLLDAEYDGGLAGIAKVLDAEYVVSLNVTGFGSGQIAFNGVISSTSKIQGVSRGTGSAATGDPALDQAEVVAKKLVDGLAGVGRFAKEKCEPAGDWVGTVTYRVVETNKDQPDRSVTSPDGSSSTNERNGTYEATFRIGWTGEPKVQARAHETVTLLEVTKGDRDCSPSSGLGGPTAQVFKSAGTRDETNMESTAESDGNTIGSVSVAITGGKLKLSVSVSSLDGTTTFTNSKHFDGGCGDPTDSKTSGEAPWMRWQNPVSREFVVPLGARPDEQAGTYTIDNETITWKLTRTRKAK